MTNGLTLACALPMYVTFITKKDCPIKVDVPKAQKEYTAAWEEFWKFWKNQQVGPPNNHVFFFFFCWLIPESPPLGLGLISSLHLHCWFRSYPVPGPAWAGLDVQAVRWEAAHYRRERRQTQKHVTHRSEPAGGSKVRADGPQARRCLHQVQKQVQVWPKMTRVQSTQHSSEPSPRPCSARWRILEGKDGAQGSDIIAFLSYITNQDQKRRLASIIHYATPILILWTFVDDDFLNEWWILWSE